MESPAYQLTEAGRKAWESKERAIPADYRLVLWLIDFYGRDYVKSLLERIPTHLLRGLLAELEELKLITRVPYEAAPQGFGANDPDRTAPFSAEVQARFERELEAASQSITKGKSYISQERRRRRAPLRKPASEAVVLIVEDDPDQLALADLRVAMAGYSVRTADSAGALQRALAIKEAPNLLLLDVMLPDGDGFDILRRLRAHRVYRDLPVILLTAKTKPDDIAKGLKLGADGYITKPYSKALLADLLAELLGK